MARKTKATTPLDVKVRTRVRRVGDRMVYTTVRSVPAVVDYADVRAAAKVEVDDHHNDPPWEDCDGYEHEAIREGRLDDMCHTTSREEPVKRSRLVPAARDDDAFDGDGWEWEDYWDTKTVYATVEHYNPDDVVRIGHYDRRLITVDPSVPEKVWGMTRLPGESKQVAAERLAVALRQTIDQLKKWYEDGWTYYCVSCDFNGEEDSLCGIDDEEYAEREVVPDVVSNVVYALEKKGYTVINKPVGPTRAELNRNGFRDRIGRNLGFAGFEEYRAWVMKRNT